MADRWEVRKDNRTFASGSMATLPDAGQRKSMREAGYQIYVDGKPYRERTKKGGD